MASNKNQHYVPRCYLKPFSRDGDGHAINLYNIDRQRSIPDAPVKGQCAASYFYGDDLRIEKLLQTPEGWYAAVVAQISLAGYRLTEEHKTYLRRFWLLQHLRTDAAAQRAALSMTEMMDIAYRGDVPTNRRTSTRDAILMAMKTFIDTMDVIDDLKVCLIRNPTRRGFITSDDPAILTNRWYQQNPRAKGMSAGTGSAGTMLILPITPRILCLIYDGDVYSVPNVGGWVEATKDADIEALNEHQYLNCTANIYFADYATATQIAAEFDRVAPHRPTKRYEIAVAVLDGENDGGKRYKVVPRDDVYQETEGLLHLRSIDPKPTRWPSIVRWRQDPKIYSNGSGLGFIRKSQAQSRFSDLPFRRI